MPKPGSLDPFGAILSGLAKRLGLESRLLELRLQHHWREIVGEPIASQTWPAHIRFKKLYLIVQNSVWLQQLTFLKPSLLAKLHQVAGRELLNEIVLRVGEIPSPPASSAAAASTDGKPSELEAEVEMEPHTAGIQDFDLRKRFTKVIAKYPSQAPLLPAKGRSRAR